MTPKLEAVRKKGWLITVLLLFIPNRFSNASKYADINLPPDHLKYYFNSFPSLIEDCQNDTTCPYQEHLHSKSCWGYEQNCDSKFAFSVPECPGDHKGWVTSKKAQLDTFYTQGDFGYIKERREEMMLLCEPLFVDDSSLECTEHLRFCRGRNIMLNFTGLLNIKEPIRYKMDVLGKGDIGGYCSLKKEELQKNADHISPLQSWGPELRNFKKVSSKSVLKNECDVVVNKPTYFMKIDAAVNMYHHFCDFFNLYASMHVNLSHPSTFSTDNYIVIWESYSYRSAFEDTFSAFTRNPILDLKTFRGKTVCFRNAVFPLLPRMIFGLYYNTPLIYGCEKSGLFKAFSEFVLHRLEIPLEKRSSSKVRVTLLCRDTQYRRILNENDLVRSLKDNKNIEIKKVYYNKHLSFKKQLEITRNSDIFIGIHGAGLTHFLFLPDWAVGFELYNCEDPSCYKDLARLRGVRYLTWENETKIERHDPGTHPHGSAHAKFINYNFDTEEFRRIVEIGVEYVRNNVKFKKFIESSQKNFSQSTKEEL